MLIRTIIHQARLIISFLPRNKRRMLWGIAALTLLTGFVEISVAGLVSLLGVALSSPASILQLEIVQSLFVLFPSAGPKINDTVILLLFLLGCTVIAICGKNILLGILSYIQIKYAQETSAFLGFHLFKSYMQKEYLWHLQQNAEELITVLSFRAQVSVFLIYFFSFITQSCIAICLLVGGIVLAPQATAIVFGITGLTAAATYKLSKHYIHRHAQIQSEAQIQTNKQLLASLHGIRDILVYGQLAHIHGGVKKGFYSIANSATITGTLPMLSPWSLESMGIATLFLSLLFLIATNASLAVITGTLSLLAAMAWRLLPCMNKSVMAVVAIQGCRPYLDRFFSAIDRTIPDGFHSAKTSPAVLSRQIVLNSISFRYPGAKTNALSNITLHIPKGRMIGVIGPSGAGKSTLVSILTGLLQPGEGTISIDDRILQKDKYAELRFLIGYVPQSPYLMDASLAENIAFSALGRPIDEERVYAACAMAALDFWERLPQGIHTHIGERAVRLSGGQAQQVAIARALYANPQLLIFDEATSALDDATEALIQQTIDGLRTQRTMVIVAHRLSTIKNCDHLYWLDAGKIVAQGPSAEILEKYQKHSDSHITSRDC